MPFLLHRPGSAEPSTLTESDAHRVFDDDFPNTEVRAEMWGKLVKGEKVFVQQGELEWVSDAEG
jgi:hypothetical protein